MKRLKRVGEIYRLRNMEIMKLGNSYIADKLNFKVRSDILKFTPRYDRCFEDKGGIYLAKYTMVYVLLENDEQIKLKYIKEDIGESHKYSYTPASPIEIQISDIKNIKGLIFNHTANIKRYHTDKTEFFPLNIDFDELKSKIIRNLEDMTYINEDDIFNIAQILDLY